MGREPGPPLPHCLLRASRRPHMRRKNPSPLCALGTTSPGPSWDRRRPSEIGDAHAGYGSPRAPLHRGFPEATSTLSIMNATSNSENVTPVGPAAGKPPGEKEDGTGAAKFGLGARMNRRAIAAVVLVGLAVLHTPVLALCFGGDRFLAIVSLAVGLLFAAVALWGRMRTLARGAITKSTLTAAYRAKRILWTWTAFGGAILVLSLSTRDPSALDEAFGMIGFGWMLPGIAALLLESAAFSLEDAVGPGS